MEDGVRNDPIRSPQDFLGFIDPPSPQRRFGARIAAKEVQNLHYGRPKR